MRLVVDANILISELLRARGRRLFTHPDIGSVSGVVLLALGSGQYTFDPWPVPMQLYGYTANSLLFGAVLVATLQSRRLSSMLAAKPLRWFGRYSYAIHLFTSLCCS